MQQPRYGAAGASPARLVCTLRLNGSAEVDLGKRVDSAKASISSSPQALTARNGQPQRPGGSDGKLQLEALAPMLRDAGLPIERTTGTVRFEVAAKQIAEDPRGLDLSLALDTNGLRVIQQREPPKKIETTADALSTQPLALEGIDLRFSAHLHPRNGETYGTLILRPQGR